MKAIYHEDKRDLIARSCCPQLRVLCGDRATLETFLPGREITPLDWTSPVCSLGCYFRSASACLCEKYSGELVVQKLVLSRACGVSNFGSIESVLPRELYYDSRVRACARVEQEDEGANLKKYLAVEELPE